MTLIVKIVRSYLYVKICLFVQKIEYSKSLESSWVYYNKIIIYFFKIKKILFIFIQNLNINHIGLIKKNLI